MTVSQQSVEQIIAAVPGFRTSWNQFLEEWKAEPPMPWYLAMSELAHYIVQSYSHEATKEFPELFGTVESLLNAGDPEIENLIAVGLFEDIQNVAIHREFGALPFRPWLGPRSLVVWDEVDAFTQRVAAWTAQQKPRWWQFWRRRIGFDASKTLLKIENPQLRKIIEADYRKIK
jgi:hypothetical protein